MVIVFDFHPYWAFGVVRNNVWLKSTVVGTATALYGSSFNIDYSRDCHYKG